MKEETFEIIWSKVFNPIAQHVLKKSQNIKFNENKKLDIWTKYQAVNKAVHNEMRTISNKIDRHKIGAILSSSILEVEPFYILKGEKYFDRLPNEIFALQCFLAVVRCFGLVNAKKENNQKVYDRLYKGFVYPPCKENTFIEHAVKVLHFSKKRKKFDIFTFALLLFTIEEYTLAECILG